MDGLNTIMMQRTIFYSLLIILTGFFISCRKFADDYLDELPNKESGIPISTLAHLESILDNHNVMCQEEGGSIRLYATDDYGLIPESVAQSGPFHTFPTVIFNGLWDRNISATLGNSDWSTQWGVIFRANLVLGNLDKVPGSEADKMRLRAEAHYVRAMSYWVLANTYCLPYTKTTMAQNGSELGLPIKTSTDFEGDLTRASLAATYDFIQSDLAEALKVNEPLIKEGRVRSWRANVAGVHAFLARFYLNMEEYALAEQHANTSLEAYSVLVDYNDPAEISMMPQLPGFPSTIFSYEDPVLWKEFTSFRLMSHNGFVVPSQDLMQIYGSTAETAQNDLRYHYFMVENGGAIYGVSAPMLYYQLGFNYLNSGTTVGETLITKAEAQARQNKVDAAITTANILREKRMLSTLPANIINLSASTQAEAITKILQERRRELPLATRWFDLRRLNHNADASDNITVNRPFFAYNGAGIIPGSAIQTYTLEPGSRKYAMMIPQTDIVASQQVIVQNRYD